MPTSKKSTTEASYSLNIYSHDDLEQYNRRRNNRIYGVTESSGKKDSGDVKLLMNSTFI